MAKTTKRRHDGGERERRVRRGKWGHRRRPAQKERRARQAIIEAGGVMMVPAATTDPSEVTP